MAKLLAISDSGYIYERLRSCESGFHRRHRRKQLQLGHIPCLLKEEGGRGAIIRRWWKKYLKSLDQLDHLAKHNGTGQSAFDNRDSLKQTWNHHSYIDRPRDRRQEQKLNFALDNSPRMRRIPVAAGNDWR